MNAYFPSTFSRKVVCHTNNSSLANFLATILCAKTNSYMHFLFFLCVYMYKIFINRTWRTWQMGKYQLHKSVLHLILLVIKLHTREKKSEIQIEFNHSTSSDANWFILAHLFSPKESLTQEWTGSIKFLHVFIET